MSDRDIDELFRKFAILDTELKQLRKEVGEIKDTLKPNNRYIGEEEEWREEFK